MAPSTRNANKHTKASLAACHWLWTWADVWGVESWILKGCSVTERGLKAVSIRAVHPLPLLHGRVPRLHVLLGRYGVLTPPAYCTRD